jgi:hypothetical protein
VRHGAGAAGDVTISNRDMSGEEGWACTELATVVQVEKAIYYALRIIKAIETR